jgi:mannan endo-1,4-beta-mannosidase
LEVANRVGVRLIIPLVDNWKWWGGIAEYAAYRDKPAEDFWTDREIIADFKQTINYTLKRRNTYTGALYKDDKAILAWETGNELYSQYPWTKEIAAYIKSLDSNHLVLDGFYVGNKEIQPESLGDPNIDIISSHHYPAPNKGPAEMVEDIKRFHQQIAGEKAYIVGEFGFIPLAGIEKVLDAVIGNGVSGAMIWSLRFHNRDGGFYWHSEPGGADVFKAYHYPGFATGKAYEETALLKLIGTKAYEIRGMTMPALEAPAAPKLLPVKSVSEITWQGSGGASSYDVERATIKNGPWAIVGMDVDDTWVQYRSLFSDAYAEPGHGYYYRVRGKNAAGTSAPSNVLGPIRAEDNTIVDELSDFSRIFARGEDLSLATANARQYKEDAHRLKGSAGSWIMYRTLHPLRAARVLAFMESTEKDFDFYLSRDGSSFNKVEPTISRFPTEVNPYGYKLPIRYELAALRSDNRFLKIVFRTEAQISRVELRHGN